MRAKLGSPTSGRDQDGRAQQDEVTSAGKPCRSSASRILDPGDLNAALTRVCLGSRLAMDILFVGLICGLFALALGFVRLCERV
jgi:hypothetical protein